MCDVRLFRSAWMDFQTAQMIWERPYNDEMILNNAAYHLQQAVEKVIKGALECAGITVSVSRQEQTDGKIRIENITVGDEDRRNLEAH